MTRSFVRTAFAAFERHRFAWLFASLLVTIGVLPAVKGFLPGFNLLEPLMALNVLVAIASVGREPGARASLMVAGLSYLVVRSLQAALGIEVLLRVSESLWAAAGALAMVATARHALRPGDVDAERIFAALDAYLLAGLTFGIVYWILELSWPGSVRGAEHDPSAAIYFSFVTIATLGYGDIVPATEPTRALAILEAVGGQMYLAVLVARLVSLYSAQPKA